MTLRVVLALLLAALAAGCAPRRDPVLEAAEDFRDSTYQAIDDDEAQKRRLNSLTLGMSSKEVLDHAGPPDSRSASRTYEGGSREVWVYQGALGRRLGRVVLEDDAVASVTVP